MGLFDFIGGLFGAGGGQDIYNVTQGLPGYTAGSNLAGLQGSQAGSQNSIAQQQAFVNALNSQGGLNGLQSGVFGQQQGLANQFGQLASGQGPNPAQAQLAQNTGQNMQQQAAMMASARGAQSNPGLIARQAGQVGGGVQQQAAGQAATLGAQQQLAGMQGMAAQQGQMAGLATAGAGQQQNALSQLGAQNQNYQQMMQQALTAQNQQQLQAQMGQAGLAKQGMGFSQGILGGLLGGAGQLATKVIGAGAPAAAAAAHGGVIGDPSMPTAQTQSMPPQPTDNIHPLEEHTMDRKGKSVPQSKLGQTLANSFETYKASKHSDGGKIDGNAQVKGDSEKNDTVPAMLSPGEVVIPRSHVDDPHKTAAFLNSLMGWNLRAN